MLATAFVTDCQSGPRKRSTEPPVAGSSTKEARGSPGEPTLNTQAESRNSSSVPSNTVRLPGNCCGGNVGEIVTD